nr:RluA family pseudouridine synthase [uncultured Sellimonas sp.]
MKPEILFEDDQILVCHKPAGTAVQTASFSSPDMVSLLKNHLMREAKKSGTPLKGAPYLAVIHRLDQPVEGILVFGKTKQAAARLSSQLGKAGFGKYYEALTESAPPDSSGTLTDYLVRDGRTNLSSVCTSDTPNAKKAVLDYRVLDQHTQEGRLLSRLSIHLHTGRHHQIRVQLAHAGCPILGDRKYNPQGIPSRRLHLCACRLDFLHPVSKEPLHFEIQPFFLDSSSF